MHIDLSTLKHARRSTCPEDEVIWAAMRAKAQFIVGAGPSETLYGAAIYLTEDEALTLEDTEAAKKAPYGDVKYADPGYQKDGQKRYPIDTEAHIRAAWSYINKGKNAGEYSSSQVSKIKARIVSAWKRVIDPKGPPSAS